jgi:hypothetical protein
VVAAFDGGAAAVTPGEQYAAAKLVRVVGPGFTAGILIDPRSGCAFFSAPILRHYLGQHEDQLRASFARLGFRATVVR